MKALISRVCFLGSATIIMVIPWLVALHLFATEPLAAGILMIASFIIPISVGATLGYRAYSKRLDKRLER